MARTPRFKDMLRKLREAKGMTQEQLAERVGVTREYITMLESGARANPTIDTLKKLAKVLKVKVGELVE